ncbi:hypothetical protein E4U09_004759 [Claviceps aff. purpurea]|uniref:Probable methionine--tRNA ligase, mitochondrial n=1 Tax=Claviceps aff. purpurea TaxID=1967640 RepID=A0A9P7U4D1_9HYPO|nr:hypothetical protein E4U09_004759 [Claviceps aff. purpurea]
MGPPSSQALSGLRRARLNISGRLQSVCSRTWPGSARWSSTNPAALSSSKKPYYITTPIFYVNDAPHIGHFYTMVLGDVLKRWQQIKGNEAFLLTGTDEHGSKVQRAAEKEGVDVKDFCDTNSNKFRDLAAAGGILNDAFMRTTDPQHKEAVSEFWLQLKHALPEHLGLYKGTHKGWYAVSDECFYPEGMVRTDIVPQTGKKIMVSVETGSEVEWVEEETWFFPLTKYKDRLLKFYDENPHWITPGHRLNEVRQWVKDNLQDLSITRPASRLSWGIPDPEDDSQTIYVWVDALVNYITQAGYGSKWHSRSEGMGIWPADMQIVGKDILRFHAIYWPALLMALGLPPPRHLLCHNHWTMSNQKMSKSVGNVVNPFFALQRWDVDTLRYYLMRNAGLSRDMSYSNQQIAVVYMKELQANMGNLLHRITRSKLKEKWSLVEVMKDFRDGKIHAMARKHAGTKYTSLDEHLTACPAEYCERLNHCHTSGALRELFNLLIETNRYISETTPWKLTREAGPTPRMLLNLVIYNAAEALRIAAILLQPVMPTKAGLMLDELGVAKDRRTVQYAVKGKDSLYGIDLSIDDGSGRMNKWKSIFPPMPDAEGFNKKFMKQLNIAFSDITANPRNQLANYMVMEVRFGKHQAAEMLAQMVSVKQAAAQQTADDTADKTSNETAK